MEYPLFSDKEKNKKLCDLQHSEDLRIQVPR